MTNVQLTQKMLPSLLEEKLAIVTPEDTHKFRKKVPIESINALADSMRDNEEGMKQIRTLRAPVIYDDLSDRYVKSDKYVMLARIENPFYNPGVSDGGLEGEQFLGVFVFNVANDPTVTFNIRSLSSKYDIGAAMYNLQEDEAIRNGIAIYDEKHRQFGFGLLLRTYAKKILLKDFGVKEVDSFTLSSVDAQRLRKSTE